MDATEESTLQGQLKAGAATHQFPETGFEEVNTSDYVARILTTLEPTCIAGSAARNRREPDGRHRQARDRHPARTWTR